MVRGHVKSSNMPLRVSRNTNLGKSLTIGITVILLLIFAIFGNPQGEDLSGFMKMIFEGKAAIPQGEVGDKPKIQVPYDLAVEENSQKSVDAGHSPWRLDPKFAAQVFASLLLSPEGIIGEYPIPYEAVELVKNNGVQAKLRINSDKSIAEYVYLERLIRQDDTGIWTVIGYDPVKESTSQQRR